jgi:hypothetical protein
MWGVTVDDVSALSSIVTSLEKLSRKPTVRIVFDELVPAKNYAEAVRAMAGVAYVMGQILDSAHVRAYGVPAYLERTAEYLVALSGVVDIWEIGNEVNGEWLGPAPEVASKVAGAFDLVKARGERAALTLYFNEGCWDRPENEMFTWAERHLPARMKEGLDFVLVSYYEDDCHGRQPSWPAIFRRLGALFPRSLLGFGEVGTRHAARKGALLRRYYGMRLEVPRFVGGYFWWYFRQDMVPHTRPLWKVLDGLMAR